MPLNVISILIAVALFVPTNATARGFLKFEPALESHKSKLLEDGIISSEEADYLKHLSLPPLDIYRIESPESCVQYLCKGIISAPTEHEAQYLELPISENVFLPHAISDMGDHTIQIIFTDPYLCSQAAIVYVIGSHLKVRKVTFGEHCDWN